MKRFLVLAALVLTGCAEAPAVQYVQQPGPVLPAELERYAAQYTATAQTFATQQASTATAAPYIQTEAAVRITETAAAVGVPQTQMALTPTAAALALQMTGEASGATSTAIAQLNYGNLAYYATATEVRSQAEHEETIRTLESVGQGVWIAAGLTFIVFILLVGAAAFVGVARFGRVRSRYVLLPNDVFDAEERKFMRGPVIEAQPIPPVIDKVPAEAAYYEAWDAAIQDAATVAGLAGGWSVSLMCEQYPANERPISEDDRERIVTLLIDAGILVKGQGRAPTNYGQGQNYTTLKEALEDGLIAIPPYSEAAKPPPRVDISLAQRNATQHNTAKSTYTSPLKRSSIPT